MGMKTWMSACALGLLLVWCGCKEQKKSPTGAKGRNLVVKKGQLYTLELFSIETEKLVGGEEAATAFKFFVAKNQILLFTHSGAPHVFTLGFTAPPGSYRRSNYPRVRGRSDTYYVHLPNLRLNLIKDNGREFILRVGSIRIKPREEPGQDGIIGGEFNAEIRGSFAVEFGQERFAGDFFGTWYARLDTKAPEVGIVPPDRGLVSGSFDVYFDEPVTSNQAQNRIALRDSKNKEVKIKATIEATDLNDFTTHIRVDPIDLLPFNEKLGLAVAVGTDIAGFADLGGNRLPRPKTLFYDAPDYPPQMNSVGHDFDKARKDEEFRLQRDVRIVDEHFGVRPHRGRMLLITPPPAGSRYSSAMLARIQIDDDTRFLQLKVAKVADTNASLTPCLQLTVAQVDGMPWRRVCAPTDVPSIVLETERAEVLVTPWVPITVDVEGQRGRQVVIELEARPLDPATPVGSNPRFLIDMIRPIWEGQNRNEFE